MSLGGTYQDHYLDMFKDTLLHEAQQKGSRLRGTVMVENMDGNKTYFDKLGQQTNYTKTTRAQQKTYSDITFERRQVQEQFFSFDHILDREDLIKYVQDPRNEVVQGAVWEMGRTEDEIIMDALSGNAVVTTNGSTANQALLSANQIAVNNHVLDSGSGDVGLSIGKLKLARAIIEETYGSDGGERMFCVAPIRQIMNLTQENQVTSRDFRDTMPLEGPGVVSSLSGYLGMDFIAYEDTGTDGNSDELAYVYTDSAIKMGMFEPLTVEIDRDTTRTGNPDVISVYEALGATRMYEEKVVQIACDPLA